MPNLLLVRIHTNDGLIGCGETYYTPHAISALIHDWMAERLLGADALAWLKRCSPQRFELVLLDPPFDADIFEAALTAAAPTIVPGGFIYLEAPRAFDTAPDGLALHRHLRAGAVHAHLLVRSQG